MSWTGSVMLALVLETPLTPLAPLSAMSLVPQSPKSENLGFSQISAPGGARPPILLQPRVQQLSMTCLVVQSDTIYSVSCI